MRVASSTSAQSGAWRRYSSASSRPSGGTPPRQGVQLFWASAVSIAFLLDPGEQRGIGRGGRNSAILRLLGNDCAVPVGAAPHPDKRRNASIDAAPIPSAFCRHAPALGQPSSAGGRTVARLENGSGGRRQRPAGV